VRKFAREQFRPYVREMDEAGVFRKDIIRQFFEMGLMGSRFPRSTAGRAALLSSDSGVRSCPRGPSAGVIVDVQNTICNNALLRWATPDQKAKYLRVWRRTWWRATPLSEAGSAATPRGWPPRAEDRGDHFILNGRKAMDHERGGIRLLPALRQRQSEAGYKGVTAFLIEREFPGFAVGKKEDQDRTARLLTCELILDNCRVPREKRDGRVGERVQDRDRDVERGRIAIGGR